MGIKGFWGRLSEESLFKLSNSLAVIANYFFNPPPPPPPSPPSSSEDEDPANLDDDNDGNDDGDDVPANPLPQGQQFPTHHVLEVVPFELEEKRKLLKERQARELASEDFEELLQRRTLMAMRQHEDQLGEAFPGCFITWIFEGKSTLKEKRAEEQAKSRYKDELKVETEEKKKERARKKVFKNRDRKKRREKENNNGLRPKSLPAERYVSTSTTERQSPTTATTP
ncbi:uncharacterized protein JCM6883_004050, partial [Sporobolomyces salmoneus]|uniref:uncharacterized protein n=1 Tax=Sporobolomyces salmoneus TaxID=183962 RepID=UPI00316F7363